MVFANTADVVDALHRLLARSRALVRNQRLLLEALEEAVLWLPVPPSAPVLNGPTLDVEVWANVARLAGHADGAPPTSTVPVPRPAHAVLLQPGLPSNLSAIRDALPGLPDRDTAGLRRRLWRRHVAEQHVLAEGSAPSATASGEPLFLVQTDESAAVPIPANHPPLRRVPRGQEVHQRRRLQHPRRVGLFLSNGLLESVSSEARPGSSGGVVLPNSGVATSSSAEGVPPSEPVLSEGLPVLAPAQWAEASNVASADAASRSHFSGSRNRSRSRD